MPGPDGRSRGGPRRSSLPYREDRRTPRSRRRRRSCVWHRLPQEWQEAEAFGDQLVYVTPAELLELRDGIDALIGRFHERNTRPELRPEGAELVQVLRIAYRRDQGRASDAAADADEAAEGSAEGSAEDRTGNPAEGSPS